MCTINQKNLLDKKDDSGKKLAKSVKAWKICAFNPNTKSLLGIYNNYKWKKGQNHADDLQYLEETTNFQLGFHCFKSYRDALRFIRNIKTYFKKHGMQVWEEWNHLALIQVTLYPCSDKGTTVDYVTCPTQIREGLNSITNPVQDTSPCYVAPIAVWDGKYKEFVMNPIKPIKE